MFSDRVTLKINGLMAQKSTLLKMATIGLQETTKGNLASLALEYNHPKHAFIALLAVWRNLEP